MEKQFVTTSASPKVFVEVHGSLKLKGWDDMMVVAKNSSAEDLSLEQRGEEIYVRCTSNCSVRVPRKAEVTIQAAYSNAVIKGIEGSLIVQAAHGDLDLRSVGPATIQLVDGTFTAKNVFGDLTLDRINGNATVRDVQGDFTVSGGISGNLQLGDVDGSASAKADGNANIRIDPVPGEKYSFSADGNLLFRLPEDASIELLVESAGDRITINLPDVHVSEAGSQPYSVTLGDGDASVVLSAGGNVAISGQAPDWDFGSTAENLGAEMGAEFSGMAEEISSQVAQQVEVQMEMLGRQLESQMSHLSTSLSGVGLSAEQTERLSQRAREAAERAAARAQERMQAAQERMQRKVEAAQRRAEQRARYAERTAHNAERRGQSRERRWGFEWPSAKAQAAQSGDPVSEEERLVILKMLEEKQISLEDADKLLSALEGKE